VLPLRLRIWFAAMLGLSLAAGEAFAAELVEDFHRGQFDRDSWTVDPRNPPGVKMDLKGERWHVVIPAGEQERPPAQLQSRFKLDGDFDIRVDFELLQFVPPEDKQTLKIELYISSEGGSASVMRQAHPDAEAAYAIWYGPPKDSAKKGIWKRVEGAANAGVLRMRRQGSILVFEATEPGQDLAVPLGEVEFGRDAIQQVALRVGVPATKKSTDVAFDHIWIAADKIIGVRKPEDSLIGAWGIAGMLAFFGTGLLLLMLARWLTPRVRPIPATDPPPA